MYRLTTVYDRKKVTRTSRIFWPCSGSLQRDCTLRELRSEGSTDLRNRDSRTQISQTQNSRTRNSWTQKFTNSKFARTCIASRTLYARIVCISLAYLQNCHHVYNESCVSPSLLQRFLRTAVAHSPSLVPRLTLSRRATNTMATKKQPPGTVAMRWGMPGSKYIGVVHFVSNSLVDEVGDGRVVVWWPNRSKGKRWEGQLVGRSLNLPYFTTSLHGIISRTASCSVLNKFHKQVHRRYYSKEIVCNLYSCMSTCIACPQTSHFNIFCGVS